METNSSVASLLDVIRAAILDSLTHAGFLWEVIIGTSISFMIILSLYKASAPVAKAIFGGMKTFWDEVIMGTIESITDFLMNKIPRPKVIFEKPKKDVEIKVKLEE